MTKHGLQRLLERGFTPEEIIECIKNPTWIKNQSNNTKVLIKLLPDNKYNFIVINDLTDKVITGLKKIDKKAIINQGKGYGWTI